MITKETLIEFIQSLPKEEYELDEILEEIVRFEKIHEGLEAVKNGRN